MNIIQVLRQYNPKSMERRGINLAVSLSLRRPGPARSFRPLPTPVRMAVREQTSIRWWCRSRTWAHRDENSWPPFSSPLSFSGPFFRKEKRMVTTLDVSPKSKTISDYLENVQRGEYLIWIIWPELKTWSRDTKDQGHNFIRNPVLKACRTYVRARCVRADANERSCGCIKNATARYNGRCVRYVFILYSRATSSICKII